MAPTLRSRRKDRYDPGLLPPRGAVLYEVLCLLRRYAQVNLNRRLFNGPHPVRVPAFDGVFALVRCQARSAFRTKLCDHFGGLVAIHPGASKEPCKEKGSVVSTALREPAAQGTESVKVTKPPLVQCCPSLASIWNRRSAEDPFAIAFTSFRRRNSEECLQMGQLVTAAVSVRIEVQFPPNVLLAFGVKTPWDPYVSGSVFRSGVGSDVRQDANDSILNPCVQNDFFRERALRLCGVFAVV